MKRFDCLKVLAAFVTEEDLVVTNLGNTAFEWRTARDSRANVYNLNLGQCTPVALGLSLALPHRRVTSLDGDGNLLLHLASLADTAYHKPKNLRVIVFDNEAYENPGGMPTATAHGVDLERIGKGCGIEKSFTVTNIEQFTERAKVAFAEEGLCLIVAKIEIGTIKRPVYTPMDYKFNKYVFATYIEETEKKPVFEASLRVAIYRKMTGTKHRVSAVIVGRKLNWRGIFFSLAQRIDVFISAVQFPPKRRKTHFAVESDITTMNLSGA